VRLPGRELRCSLIGLIMPIVLIVMRFPRGVGAAVMVPQIVSVIQMRFTGKARAQALSAYGLVMCALSYLGISLAVHGGAQGRPLFWASRVVNGAAMGASFSPLLTQSLVHVPLQKAADASGLSTTTMQLCQVAGIVVFGTVFLSLERFVPGIGGHALSSARSPTTTSYWLAGLSMVGVISAAVLARTVLQARLAARAAATAQAEHQSQAS
jgi:hypothetical protein